ncbi:VanZ family protein [Paeniglutamicibacter gangotriensis Lz1y]|uniref:VanZ family protein n=2 Tax=Paeniglutamicibacter gangotriensis TaxID=254787 RepID=M7MU58_9MICC|nr:VanZ family protein [Paeniglutamicibacter gangotriensis Lz1y]
MVIGVLAAVALLIPFIAISYRRRGHISALWLLGWIALAIYAMSLWTYTLMPLPQEGYRCVGMQLTPFASVNDARGFPHATVGQILRNPSVQQVAFNLILFMPLGFLLRAMFRREIVAATLTGAAISLFIEVTQKTGVWGLFPCAYRLFDVDDLMVNTLGALIGSIVALVFVRPRTSRIDPAQPRAVTAGRRLLGMLCDMLFLALLGSLLAMGWAAWQRYILHVPFEELDQNIQTMLALWVPLAVQLIWIMASGQTVGESATLLRGRPTRIPAVLARPLRFVAGIGGYGILTGLDFPFSGLLLTGLVIVILVMVWSSRNHRGFAAMVAGMELEDARIRVQARGRISA